MGRLSSFIALIISISLTPGFSQNTGSEYIEKWKQFYPSKALARGFHASIFEYEDLSSARIRDWLLYNKEVIKELSDQSNGYVSQHPIDSRLLRVQIQSEIEKWEHEKVHQKSVILYSTLISNATKKIIETDFLNTPEKGRIICNRLQDIVQLCTSAKESLLRANKTDIKSGMMALQKSEKYYREELPGILKEWPMSDLCADFDFRVWQAAKNMQSLISFVNTRISPTSTNSSQILGRDEYARKLKLYTDSSLTPEELSEMALHEIQVVKELMLDVSKEYLGSSYPETPLPTQSGEIIRKALHDMEKDAPKSASDYLDFWKELAASASEFIESKAIATLPKNETLRIMTAPESAGPAARIGWVSSAPPFDPNPMTTLYLPSIPDTLPKQEQIEFWASFNKPFNRMIVIHELFPGHYMQLKIARKSPHPIRLLFPYGPYIEGWATFTERVVLDAGWERDRPLTFLAHLRKRLENANRAYTSVQVHCNGWDREKVMIFSTETSLLAPQFAKSLWGRLMSSPMQLTSYFYGGQQFMNLLEREKERLGDGFVLVEFMDTILREGPIPIDEYYRIFEESIR